MTLRTWIVGAAAAALLAGGTLLAQTGSAPVADESSGDASEAAAAALRNITDDPAAPKLAPQGYDVTVVSFADYQCPFCRKLHPQLERLAEEDRKVRIVYRDWPIFGPASEEAARAAIASQWQGKHAQFNDALMHVAGKLDSAKIRAAADKAGVDWARLQQDLRTRNAEIAGVLSRTDMLAAELGLQGTPALLIGEYLVPGALDYPALTEAVKMARELETSGEDEGA